MLLSLESLPHISVSFGVRETLYSQFIIRNLILNPFKKQTCKSFSLFIELNWCCDCEKILFVTFTLFSSFLFNSWFILNASPILILILLSNSRSSISENSCYYFDYYCYIIVTVWNENYWLIKIKRKRKNIYLDNIKPKRFDVLHPYQKPQIIQLLTSYYQLFVAYFLLILWFLKNF